MVSNIEARSMLVTAIETLRSADPDGSQKQISSSIQELESNLAWLDDDIRTDSGPIRIGDLVDIGKYGITGTVQGGLGNFLPDLIPVAVPGGSALLPRWRLTVLKDVNGNPPTDRPDEWPESDAA